MSVNTIRELIKELDEQIVESDLGNPFFSNPEYKAFPLILDNFKPIESVESKRKIAFVDGGNQELVGAPNFSVQINRIYFNIFQGDKRFLSNLVPRRIEFFSATFSKFQKDEIYYNTSLLPVNDKFTDFLPNETDLSFSSTDRTVTIGTMRADIFRVASIARRFAEWEFARHVINGELGEGDLIVRDGTLQRAFTNEWIYLKKAYDSAKKHGVIFSGLSKTCSLFTDTGLPLLGAVRKLATDNNLPYPIWYYHPIADIFSSKHEASIFIVKLHPKAEHIFRYEIYRTQAKEFGEGEINEILSRLSENSKDATLPGYPYGLIDADYYARVRNTELEKYQMILLSEISKLGKWEKFKKYMQATDAHNVLNMFAG